MHPTASIASTSVIRMLVTWIAILACAKLIPGQSAPPDLGETSHAFLGKQLDQKISELDWGENPRFSFCVMDLEGNLPIYARDADQPLPPGSPVKLYTALAALDLLGPDFRFSTTFQAEGWIAKRRLEGDLFKSKVLEGRISIVGGGDPSFSFDLAGSPEPVLAQLDAWIKPMLDRGVDVFAGEIVVDASLFDPAVRAPGWPETRAASPGFPEVAALNFNDNCVELHWNTRKIREGKIAPYTMTPPLPRLILLSNNVRVQRTNHPFREFERAPDSNVVKTVGMIPPDDTAHDRVAVARPPEFFGEAFAARLQARGLKFFGSVRPGKAEALPVSAAGVETGLVPFSHSDTIQSPPLEQIVAAMLRNDRSLDAECIVRTLGLKKGSGPSFGSGAEVVLNHLRGARIAHSGLALMDGSGNSDLNRASARHLVAVLDAIRKSPYNQRILDSLAQNGQPGDLANRVMVGVDAEAQNPVEVHAIAGNPTGGGSIAGWVLSRGGRRIYFALMVSGSSLPTADLNQRLDSIVAEIARSAIR